jgi:ComEC/Rec2-related protein
LNLFTVVNVAFILIYLLVGLYCSRVTKSLDDYYIMDQNAPSILITGTLIATNVSSVTFIGYTGSIYTTRHLPYTSIFGLTVITALFVGLYLGRYFWRMKISTFYDEILPENLSSLLSGVVLGVKGNISREILSYFSDAGVMHLFAISGLHVGIIFSAVDKLFDAFNVSHITSFIIGSFTSIFYCFLVGLTPSVLRATIMIIILFLAPIAERTYDALNSICLAAFIILLINPMYLFSVSFQLSFCATLGIILFFGQFRKYFSKFPVFLRDSLSVIFSAQLLEDLIL